jgi:hypothetical protein
LSNAFGLASEDLLSFRDAADSDETETGPDELESESVIGKTFPLKKSIVLWIKTQGPIRGNGYNEQHDLPTL